MKFTVRISLSQPMYEELRQAAREASTKGEVTDPICTPEQFAAECVESILASRRLERIPGTPHTLMVSVNRVRDVNDATLWDLIKCAPADEFF